MVEITVAELAKAVGGELVGDGSRVLTAAAPLDQAQGSDLAFLANPRYEQYMATTKAGAVIVSADYHANGVPLIRCKDPYFAFREAMVKLYGFRPTPFLGVHRKAYVDQRATLGRDVVIAPYATVCAGAAIGDGTVLYPGVFIGPNVRIGEKCTLYPNVVIYDNCVLGNRVTIHANSVIGEDGFGYATHAGAHHKIPQAGHVIVEDDVEIGACCAIDRAAIGASKIGAGTKFSNLIAIGHGTELGKHNLLVAQTGIAGSVTVGDYCVFAGQAGVVGHITIGARVKVGAQAGVVNDVAADSQILGSPAMPLTQAKRMLVAQTTLPQLRDQVKKLTKELAELKRQMSQLAGEGDSDGASRER